MTCPLCVAQSPRWAKKRKLAIKLADDLTHCWVCGFRARSLLPLLKKFGSREDIALYREKFAPVSLNSSRCVVVTVGAPEREELRLPESFTFLATASLRDPDVRAARSYLAGRGLTERDLWYYKFGIAPRSFNRRVVMPSFGATGLLNFYTARALDDGTKPKYVDPPKEVVEKNAIIFNEINIDWKQELLIVEGPFDLTKCPANVTALQGNQLTEDTALFNEIIYHETPCCLMLDDDARMRASKIAKLLVNYGIPARIAPLGGKHDPGEMTREEVIERVGEAVPWTWDDHMREKFQTIRTGFEIREP